MKALVLSVAVLLGASIYANAGVSQTKTADSNISTVAVLDQKQDGYVDVKIESLNAEVQEAVRAFETNYTVKNLAFDKAKKLTKVTLISKADKKEKVVILNEQGKEIKGK